MSKIPEGFHTITPYLVVKDADKAIELYSSAFDGVEAMRMPAPDGKKIMHACMQIGSSMLFLCDEMPEQQMLAGDGARFYLYFDDVDAQHKQAVDAGMKEKSPPADMFWGDRMSVVTDPFGNEWTLASHVRDVSEEEMAEAMKQMAAQGG